MTAPKALLAAFFGGLVPIFVIRALLPDVVGAIAATMVAVAAIALLGLHYHRDSQLADRQLAGDNLYYLGLLFTLASLIIALSQLFLFNGEGSVEGRAYDLIGNFGIALVSTVAGILGRILLQSAGEEYATPKEALVLPRTALEVGDAQDASVDRLNGFQADDVMALRLALRQATDAFSHFTRITTNQAQQTIAHTEKLIRAFNDDMTTAASLGLRDAAGTWQQTAQAMHEDAEQLARRFDDLIGSFNERITEAARSGIEEAAGSWRNTAQTMLADNERMGERLRLEVEEVTARTEVAGKALMELADSVKLSTQRMTSEVANVASMVENAASASDGMNKLSGSLEAAQRGLGDLAQRAGDAAARLEGCTTEVVEAHSAFAQDAKKEQEAVLREYKNAVSEFADSTREGLAHDGDEWLSAVKKIRGRRPKTAGTERSGDRSGAALEKADVRRSCAVGRSRRTYAQIPCRSCGSLD